MVNPNLIKEAEFEIEKSINLMEHKIGRKLNSLYTAISSTDESNIRFFFAC